MKGIDKKEGLYYFFKIISNRFANEDAGLMVDNDVDVIALLGIRWYNRLGYPSLKVLKHLSLIKGIKDVDVCSNCSVCPLTKQTRLHFSSSMSKANNIFYLIHMDV